MGGLSKWPYESKTEVSETSLSLTCNFRGPAVGRENKAAAEWEDVIKDDEIKKPRGLVLREMLFTDIKSPKMIKQGSEYTQQLYTMWQS